MAAQDQPVLILRAGINGAALARELVLNHVPVCLVDIADIAAGTTAYSSRLIHGGLRYLEYGELDLVRESLQERNRWLKLAPQYVRPLELFIPIRRRFSGALTAARRFFHWTERRQKSPPSRGLWPIRFGLWLYDTLARDPNWPRHRVHRAGDPGAVAVDSKRYRWLASYVDAQIVFPERFTLALVKDAERISSASGVRLQVFTYHEATLAGSLVSVRPVGERADRAAAASFQPSAIVNATGAWVDQTLRRLHVPSPRLLGGTKGSHFITADAGLADRLQGRAVYAEASDGRPIFVLPFLDKTLVGTTDIPFEGDPAQAVAARDELDYLLGAVNEIFAGLQLNARNIDMHYSGVRPLPYTGASTPAGITRRHWMEEHPDCAIPLYSVIGGKLTTCRSLAEEAATTILARLQLPKIADSRDRPLPGGENYPPDSQAVAERIRSVAARHALDDVQVEAIWRLCGAQTDEILGSLSAISRDHVIDTVLPRDFVRWVIRSERVTTLDDLVERRLMLLFERHLSRACLTELAQLLVEAGRLPTSGVDDAVQATVTRLATKFGKRIL